MGGNSGEPLGSLQRWSCEERCTPFRLQKSLRTSDHLPRHNTMNYTCIMPLIIYFDTQDYINLFNEPEHGPNHEVLAKILAYRDRNEIVIGFSFATIVEFITKPDAENRSERVRRGQLIKDICGLNSFPYITDLARGATFPNGGRWMLRQDESVVSATKFKRQMHSKLVEAIEGTEGLNRSQRRKLGRKATMAELIRRSGSTWGRKRSDYGELPVSDEIISSRIIERFLKGQCSDAEFEQRINAWFSDPAEYSRIVYDYADHPNFKDKYFGKPTDDVEKIAGKMQDIIADIQKINAAQLVARTKLEEAGFDKAGARRLTKQFVLPAFNPGKGVESLEAFVGKGRAGHFFHYLSRLATPGYSFKRSDMMDLMQMCYAYECDLFRCDKAMAHTFKNFEPFRGKLVDRFSELPERIARKLPCVS